MEEYWFVLEQSHYPPPQLPKNGLGIGNGAICLGHIIPDLTDLDGIINRSEEGIKFSPSVRVYHEESWSLDWQRDTGLEAGLAANIEAPIGAGTPVSAKEQTKLAFEHTVKNYEEFDTLDEHTIQVNRLFISRILDDEAVAARLEQTKGVRLPGLGDCWSVFMITGMIIARGTKAKSGESGVFEAMPSTTTNVADVASIGVAANFANQNNTSLSTEKTTDFVWAVRVMKIWEDAAETGWSMRRKSKGATACLCHERPEG